MHIYKNWISFQFKHRFQKNDPMYSMFWSKSEYKISAFFKKQFNKNTETEYIVGIEFLVFKTWIKVHID